MSGAGWLQFLLFAVLIAISTPLLGVYMYRVYFAKKAPDDRVFLPVENFIYRVLGIDLTEWHMVEILARNPGRLITQRQLLEEVWGISDTKSNYVRVLMVAVRRKLEPDPSRPRYFITESGSGIRFVSDEP